mmetsp:Transcript_5706/g.35544  ORF Transcript_5706/g.35544 Transcript_5706/m.35544 type:complete len:371 (-) Transcript_5706:309-1421(-)
MEIADYLQSIDNTAGPPGWTDGGTQTSGGGMFNSADDLRDMAFAESVLGKGQYKSSSHLDLSQGQRMEPRSEPSTTVHRLMFEDVNYGNRSVVKDEIFTQNGKDICETPPSENCKIAYTTYQGLLSNAADEALLDDGRQIEFSAQGRQAAAQVRRARRQAICRQKNSSKQGHEPHPQNVAGPKGQGRVPGNTNIPISLPVSLVGNAVGEGYNDDIVHPAGVATSLGGVPQERRPMMSLHEKNQEFLVALRALQHTINKLDMKTRSNFKDSLFRLARSADIRTGRRLGHAGGPGDGMGDQPVTEVQSAIDRTVATLLYHSPGMREPPSATHLQPGRIFAPPSTFPSNVHDAGTGIPSWSHPVQAGQVPFQL